MIKEMNIKELIRLLGPLTAKQNKSLILKIEDPEHFTQREFEVDFYGLKFQGHTDSLIEKHLYFTGSYEAGILQKVKEILSESQDSIFVDIGANIGVHTLFASLFAKKVYAFEPYQLVRERLITNIELNHRKNITVFPWGLGLRDEMKTFYAPHFDNSGTGSFIAGPDGANLEINEKLAVKNGDVFFKQHQISNITLLKIDTEGSELEILMGLLPILRNEKPFLILEYGQATHRQLSRFPELMIFLKEEYKSEIFFNPNDPDYKLIPWSVDIYGNILFSPV